MSTEWYSVYSFTTTAGGSYDLSSFFQIPGIAENYRENTGWRLFQPENGYIAWYGDVESNGALEPGPGTPSDFVYTEPLGYGAPYQIQVSYNPTPTRQCVPCNVANGTGIQSCPASARTTNSVELATGRFLFDLPLLSIAGIGSGGWSFGLSYYPQFGINGIVGKNFSFPQFDMLNQLGNFNVLANVELITSANTREVFEAFIGGYSSEDTNTAVNVIRSGTGATDIFSLYASNGTVTTFYGFDDGVPAPGQMASITDRFGNKTSFAWAMVNGVAQLQSVTDSYGRTITYTYYGSEAGNLLQSITDFLGRQLNFQYDSFGHLVAVITPSILKGVEGNTFPGGTAYVFQYDSGNPRSDRQDDLIKIWYPNQTQPCLNVHTRTVDVEAVYAQATPRYQIAYGQDPTNANTYGKVVSETVGDPANGVGGTSYFNYFTTGLPSNLIDPYDDIVSGVTVNDRNGNQINYYLDAQWLTVCEEVLDNRGKNSLEGDSYTTWTSYNVQSQPLLMVNPEGNSVAYAYDSGLVFGFSVAYVRRRGLLLSRTIYAGNTIGIPSRDGSNGQTQLTQQYFYDPLFNQVCATVEQRGNPIAITGGSNVYFTPQNGGTTPTDADHSRYATIYTFDYQKDDSSTVSGDTVLQAQMGLTSAEMGYLFTYINNQMTATDGTGGISAGFVFNQGDINGDGTGSGGGSGLPNATHLGNVVMTTYPSVRWVDGTSQSRVEIFTVNNLGQQTTMTDPEGNLTVYVRYPENDPDGDGQYGNPALSSNQYGRLREVHQDADPNDVMSLVGAAGDLVDFIPGIITRTNTPNVYQDLVTRYEGATGCVTCSYDALGNILNQTDPRGFTTISDRNEMGEIYRTTSPAPYNFRVETSYDANRNVIQVDTEDRQPRYASSDPTDAGFGHFTPSGSGSTAHVPMMPGPGGAVRPGWFSNLYTFDLLDNRIEEDIDATGSTPSSLTTQYEYDPNQNLIKVTKPEGNTVEYDYDERNLKIAERLGFDAEAGQPGSITCYSYDDNGNLVNVISPVNRTGNTGTAQTVTIADAFRSGVSITHTGDWTLENVYDGFDRTITSTDAVGNVVTSTYDPTSTLIERQTAGPIGGASPTNRTGTGNQTLSDQVQRYDEAMRLYESQQNAFLAATATLPSSRAVTHTGGGLATNSTANDHTATVTLTSGGSSYVLARTQYDRLGRMIAQTADNTATTIYAYDGAGRAVLVTDPLSNTTATEYDGNGSAIFTTRTEVCTITSPAVANEVFVTFMRYDCLGRLVVSGTQGADGNLSTDLTVCCTWPVLPSTLFSQYAYDSRGNRAGVIDPKLNVTLSVFDGASRLIETQQQMRELGDGANPPLANTSFLTSGGGVIRTEITLDGNGRLTYLTDDRGNATVYAYDLLDRQVAMTFSDGSVRTNVYNLASDLVGYTDENGSVFTHTVDALGRRVTTAISLATGVGGTTAQSFQYDGLSRRTQAIDTVGSTSAEVDLYFDSLGRTLEEKQAYGGNTHYVTHDQWTSYVAMDTTYPNDRQVASTYDSLYRRNGVSDTDGSIAGWQFFGRSRNVEQTLGNGIICTQMNNARTHSAVQSAVINPAWGDQSSDRLGYDGAGRTIAKRFLTGGINGTTHAYNNTTALVGFTTSFDRANNKLYERHLHAEERSHLYQPFNSDGNLASGYDSIDRLLQYQRGVLSSTGGYLGQGGGSVTTPIALPNTDESRAYDLDTLGNWKSTTYMPVGGSGATELRRHNAVNQITKYASTAVLYDHGNNSGAQGNGNIINDGTRSYEYDALNRLINVYKTPSSPVQIAAYTYDAMGRRIRKVITNGGLAGDIPDGTTDYAYDSDQCLEELNGDGETTTVQYVWGQYIDELVQMKICASGQALAPGLYYPLQDLLYRTTALTRSSGFIAQAYDTDAYGNTLIFSNFGTGGDWWADDATQTDLPACVYIFTGRQYDPETEIYWYRARYYIASLGRFSGKDPREYISFGSLYEYVYSSPSSLLDPSGLDPEEEDLPQWLKEFLGSLGFGTHTKGCASCPANAAEGCPCISERTAALFAELAVREIIYEYWNSQGKPSKGHFQQITDRRGAIANCLKKWKELNCDNCDPNGFPKPKVIRVPHPVSHSVPHPVSHLVRHGAIRHLGRPVTAPRPPRKRPKPKSTSQFYPNNGYSGPNFGWSPVYEGGGIFEGGPIFGRAPLYEGMPILIGGE